MRKSRFTEPQIMAVFRQAESGVAVPKIFRHQFDRKRLLGGTFCITR